mmetsp:Transcript_56723/g.101148  ORF Transcript_56723/g.101148 Transcript_56723/m.101148 type:complete len:93 (+) Transcript_56723:1281-1559(+)
MGAFTCVIVAVGVGRSTPKGEKYRSPPTPSQLRNLAHGGDQRVMHSDWGSLRIDMCTPTTGTENCPVVHAAAGRRTGAQCAVPSSGPGPGQG